MDVEAFLVVVLSIICVSSVYRWCLTPLKPEIIALNMLKEAVAQVQITIKLHGTRDGVQYLTVFNWSYMTKQPKKHGQKNQTRKQSDFSAVNDGLCQKQLRDRVKPEQLVYFVPELGELSSI